MMILNIKDGVLGTLLEINLDLSLLLLQGCLSCTDNSTVKEENISKYLNKSELVLHDLRSKSSAFSALADFYDECGDELEYTT